MTTKFRVSPVMTTSIPLHKYDATECIIFMQPGENWLNERSSLNPLRISRPKIDKLACQAQGADIFAKGEIPLYDANYIHFKITEQDIFEEIPSYRKIPE